VAADRGYGEQSVDDDLHDLGVNDVVVIARKSDHTHTHPESFRPVIDEHGYGSLGLITSGARPGAVPRER